MQLNLCVLQFRQGGMPRRDSEEEEGGASRKRQRSGLSVQDAAGSAEAHSRGMEESRSVLEPVTVSFSMRCDAVALAGRTEALDAALRKVATEFGGVEFRMERTRVGPNDDTLQRILPSILEHVGPDVLWPCFRTCRAWRRELEGRGFCRRTWQLCSTGATGSHNSAWVDCMKMRLEHNGLRHLDASTLTAEQVPWFDANAFMQRWNWEGTLHERLQAASQEPDASFLSKGAASTAEILGLPLVQWAGKPQERYRGLCTLTRSGRERCVVAVSPDGKQIVSGSDEKELTLWDAERGGTVRTSEARNPKQATRSLSHIIYLLICFRKSTPSQNRQLIVYLNQSKY